jgi:hypothetical protein
VIEYGPEAVHIEERDGCPYAPPGATSRTFKRVAPYYAKKIDAPELAPDVCHLLDDLLAIDATHLERLGRRERIETVSLLEEFLTLANVRPETPNASYCILPGELRWEKTMKAQPRWCKLLSKLLESSRPVSIDLISTEFVWSIKTLQNEVSKLRKLLVRINFPKKLKWGNGVLSLV